MTSSWRGVAKGRKVTKAQVKSGFGDGKVFDAQELVNRGMADSIATLPQTLERFGMSINPIASAKRAEMAADAGAAEVLLSKLRAGDRPTTREWDHGLRGLGLSRSQAERAVARGLMGTAQGEPGKRTETTATMADIASLRESLDGIRQFLKP